MIMEVHMQTSDKPFDKSMCLSHLQLNRLLAKKLLADKPKNKKLHGIYNI